jgi:hypothetical protein
MYLAVALVIPASLLVFLPISVIAGVVVAAVLYGGSIAALSALAPVVSVEEGELRAGRARIPLLLVGEPRSFRGAEATLERGQRLDARAWLCIRGWVDPVVTVPILDPTDPVPYWVLSTRAPERLIAAIEGSRRQVVKR